MEPVLSPERSRLLQLLRSKVRTVGHDIVAQTLRRIGVTHVFGSGGNPTDATLAACARAGIRVIGARHQQGAVLMSLAYNYVSGGLRSAVIVASAPAVTNCATGVLVGHDNRWPLLMIGGRRGLSRPGSFQAFDGAQFFAPITKSSALVDSADRVAAGVSLAARMAMCGTPGPAYLDIAEEALDGIADFAAPAAGASGPAPEPSKDAYACQVDPARIRAAVAMLLQARRPVVLIGKGARWSEPSELLRQLTDDWTIPFATSPMGRGMLPDDHPLCFSAIRGRMLADADLVLVVGARLDWAFRFGSEISSQAQVIHIDIDATEASNVLNRGLGLQGDAAIVLRQLLAALDTADNSRHVEHDRRWLDALSAARAALQPRTVPPGERGLQPMSPYEWLAELGAAMPTEAITVLDGNVVMTAAQRMLSVNYPATRLGPGTNGCMGVGIPFAIGAKLARPDLPVIAIVGDFAFGLSAIELETAVRHHVPVVIVVANNAGAGGATRQRKSFPADHPERVLRYCADVRHDLTMASFGGLGRRIESAGEIGAALSAAIASEAPVCIDVVTNENTAVSAAI